MPSSSAHHHSASSSNADRAADSMARLSVSSGPPRRPRTIAELAEAAKLGTDDDSLPLKQYLRNAETARKHGRRLYEEDDLENAFIQLARAATIVLEKLPAHKDYRALLNSTQRHNMGLHGQEILDQLATIKNTLLEQAEAYDRLPSTSTVHAPPVSQSSSRSPGSAASNVPHRNRPPQSSRPSPPDPPESYTEDARYGADDGGRRSARYADERVAQNGSRSQLPAPVIEYAREEQRRRAEEKERYEQQQEEMKRRGEDILRRRMDEKRRQEQDGITLRQREAEFAAHAARSAPPVPTVSVSAPVAVPAHNLPSPMPIPFLQLPLESPSRPQSGLRSGRTPLNRTRTTPPPVQPIEYPSLMSQHQIKQGYTPSATSVFAGSPPPGALQQPNPSQALYSNPTTVPSMPYGLHGAPSRPMPPSVPPTRVQAPPAQQTQSSSSSRGIPKLRQVDTPREVIDRFIAIAGINTRRNRETCGLLLGRDDGHRFYVTTLLIPRQHSTSDTCTMDEEELVLEFTETRSLVTLGWIHTHPTQSCFMSSVDLHTHSGFQRMLPESFAIVCAPKYNPSFGIFRLTDPPGLQIVLDCQAKEAFHPHPPAPIYTDADKNHVVLTDLPLEIVDIRD
ncbi:hypothetical protein PENSPDRAFT_630656 [Peniophora sp. CONT]|nr:hypothetical protein PENSPDRAFT_630656 [Peniophora sp. CONT]